jgi:hypothetical protein
MKIRGNELKLGIRLRAGMLLLLWTLVGIPGTAAAQTVTFLEMARYLSLADYQADPYQGGGILIGDGGTAYDTDAYLAHRTRIQGTANVGDNYDWYFYRPDGSQKAHYQQEVVYDAAEDEDCWSGFLYYAQPSARAPSPSLWA